MTSPKRVSWCTAGLLMAVLAGTPAAAVAQDPSAPAPGSAPPGPGILGATMEVYRDAFDAAPTWLDLGEDESGRTALDDGAVLMSISGDPANYRDSYELPQPAEVIRVEASVDIDDDPGTAAGVSCGSALGLPRAFVAGVNNADEWWLGRIIEGRLSVVDRGLVMLPTSPSRSAVRVAIECAVARQEGGDYVAVSVDGRPVSVATGLGRLDIPVGPYGQASLFVGTDGGTGSARFDDLVVHVGDAFARRPADRDPTAPSQ